MSFEACLCKEIILEDFGTFTATICSLLVTRGRLTLQELARYSKYSVGRVREALVVLIEHGIVFFTEATDEKKESTYYEANVQNILMRLRMGRIMRVTEEHYGKTGSAICQLLFLYGRVKLNQVKELAKTNDRQKDETAYEKAFTKMAMEQFITAVLPQHSRSKYDRFLEAEQKELEKYTITTAKDLSIIKSAAQANVDAIFKQHEHIGMKRKAVDPLESVSKRVHGDLYFMDDDEEKKDSSKPNSELPFDIDPNVFFVLNYEKYNMNFRNHMVADFATTRINRTAGTVIKTFFRNGKSKMIDIKEDYSPPATVLHIANLLEPKVFLRGDIVIQGQPKDKKPDISQVAQAYINVLRSDTAGFIKNRDELGSGQYSVNFKKLRVVMKRTLLEGLLTDRFGVASCRIVRILLDKGKLDESQIQKLAMLPLKDIRHKLGVLLTHGIVEIQEVPRSADRAPGRSFHLWCVPAEKCFQELLVDVYRATVNLQQRKRQELKLRERLLDKLNRVDVIQNMDILNSLDKANVTKMDKVVETLEVAKDRLDEMVMILRDF